MFNLVRRPFAYASAFLACFVMSLSTGCASGGFKLTREYARFVNKQMIIIRIILYVLTSIIFAATMLIDMVIFNTLDFWEGRVSAGDYKFQEGEKTYHVRHEVTPEGLKRSEINVRDAQNVLVQNVVLAETSAGEIETFIDGQLRSRVTNISDIPVATTFDVEGRQVSVSTVLATPVLSVAAGKAAVY